MAKRYHSSKSRSSVEHHSDRFNDEMRHERDRDGMNFHQRMDQYAGMGGRRTQEMEDAGMIREDHSAIANMPQQVMIKAYPVNGNYLPEGLDDTISGVDRQMNYDDGKRREHFYPKKV